jgi:hypothetical protein
MDETLERDTEAQPGATASATKSYEFTERENVVIRKTGKRSRWWGALSVLWGFVMLATGALAVVWLEAGPGAVAVGAIYAISAIIPLLIGLNFLRAGRSFLGVVETEGLDIPHLMRALERLGSALGIQVAMAVIGILLFALGVAAAFAFPLLAPGMGLSG